MVTAILIGKLIILSGVVWLVSLGISDMRVVPHKVENEKLRGQIQSLELEKKMLEERLEKLTRSIG